MFEYDEKSDVPCMRSPLEVSRTELDRMFKLAINTGRMVTFTLEKLSWTSHWTPVVTPKFMVKFGHFGMKITGITPVDQRTVNYTWPIKGRLIDLEAFYAALFQPWNMWLLNHVSFTSIGEFRYRAIRTHDDSTISSGANSWSSVLTIRHPYYVEETLPYIRHKNHHLLGRWYRYDRGTPWRLEWVHVSDRQLSTHSRMETNKDFHSAHYPLMDNDPLVSDFLGSTELYIPPNLVSMLTDTEKVKQLRDALWWMESRARLVPRFPAWMLERLMKQITVEQVNFHLPMLDDPMNTTQILHLYSQRGNPILLWLLTRPLQIMEES